VRTDFGVRSGDAVPVHYDPMIGKIIVWAPTRDEAVARARRALDECTVDGIHTTLPFHRWLLTHAPFVSGAYDTATLAHEFRTVATDSTARDEEDAAALAALFAFADSQAPRVAPAGAAGANGDAGGSRWRHAGAHLRRTPSRS